MSLQSIINDALDAAKKFISWILPSSKKILDVALEIVNNIKNFDDSHPDIVNFLTAIIPGTVDDAIVAKVRAYLPELVVRLKWADAEVGKTPDQLVADAAAFIKTLLPDEQAVAYQLLWQLLSNNATDNSVKISDLQTIGQAYYASSTKN